MTDEERIAEAIHATRDANKRVYALEDTLRTILAGAETALYYKQRDSVNIELRAIVDLCREALGVEP